MASLQPISQPPSSYSQIEFAVCFAPFLCTLITHHRRTILCIYLQNSNFQQQQLSSDSQEQQFPAPAANINYSGQQILLRLNSTDLDKRDVAMKKFPLMSKSRKLHELITELEKNPTTSRITRIQTAFETNKDSENDNEEKEIQEEHKEGENECLIILLDFPGGSESFETAAKFCYCVKIDISASNIAALRCAGEYLEMTEEYSEENLISKSERFLTQSVLKNIKQCLKTLTSSEGLLPLAENLSIAKRCIDAIASKAASSDPSLFGWPVNDGAGNNKGGVENERKKVANATMGGTGMDSWINELEQLW
ncbi:BTB/POZ domain-containing protein [Forsythia ovata]|uniref:BTB/POZ domain-containing protein n=1 Tax=Forsythia ovata TaxID=205694 RepID=A0ABD1PEW8_9LAMI